MAAGSYLESTQISTEQTTQTEALPINKLTTRTHKIIKTINKKHLKIKHTHFKTAL
jgi:hypothetical protein